jgi:hypothetical protein
MSTMTMTFDSFNSKRLFLMTNSSKLKRAENQSQARL